MRNVFRVNEEWPKQRPRVRHRHVNNEKSELEIEDSGSQDDLGDEGFQPDQTLSLDDVKIEVKLVLKLLQIILEVEEGNPQFP